MHEVGGRLNLAHGMMPARDAAGPLPEYPEEFVCPIGGEPFIDPVVTEDGHTYERVVLERWLQEKKTSPMTNLPLKTTAVVPNIALRKAIEKWEEIAHEYAINANS